MTAPTEEQSVVEPTSRWLDADGVRVHVAEWEPTGGAPTDGRRVVLVHGLGASTVSWEPIGAPLADQIGATVTAIDLVGFGRTRAPERSATIATNERLVTAVLDQLGPATLFGNSMGGIIGMGVTARRPDLVDALVLVNPAVPNPNPGLSDWLRVARAAPVFLQSLGTAVVGTRARVIGPERVVDASLAWSIHDPSRLDPGVRDRLVALATERYSYPEAAAAYVAAARSLYFALPRAVLRDLGQASEQRPVLLVHGALDRLVPLVSARGAVERCPAVTLEVLEGIGHAPQLEDPDLLVETVLSWLGREDVRNARMGPWQASSSSRFKASSKS